jgi:hypothetical protein
MVVPKRIACMLSVIPGFFARAMSSAETLRLAAVRIGNSFLRKGFVSKIVLLESSVIQRIKVFL